jgi:hypothetical protein
MQRIDAAGFARAPARPAKFVHPGEANAAAIRYGA